MLEKQRLTVKKLDSFLSQGPKVLKQIKTLVQDSNEFNFAHSLFFKLMQMASSDKTLNLDLVNFLANDTALVKLILKKAKLINSASLNNSLKKADIQNAIKRVGFNSVQEEVQNYYIKKYINKLQEINSKDCLRYFKKSLRLALFVKEFSKLINSDQNTLLFFQALNTYMPQMILSLRMPAKLKAFEDLLNQGLDLKTASLAVLGFDLNSLSLEIQKKWQMPLELIEILENQNHSHKQQNKNIYLLNKFAQYIEKSLQKEQLNSQDLWHLSFEYLEALNIKMDFEDWDNFIKKAFINVLEKEYFLFSLSY
jgi:HD-like signal output (HDOD) protein